MATARSLRRFLATRPPSTAHRSFQAVVHRRLLSASPASSTTEAGGAGDPALHSGDAPSEDYTERPPRSSAADNATTGRGSGHDKQPPRSEPYRSERVPPFGPPSGKLIGSQELADPAAGTSFTQRRRFSSPEDATPGREERKVREEDREYYRTRRPSPLAEVEYADTRKPITRATDGGAAAADLLSDVKGCTVEDTADGSLARAEAMFRDAASRGDPEWPHSRALAEMLARRAAAELEDAARV